MHSKNLIYKNGHFYENGKRIEIKDNATVCIVANEDDFILIPEDLFFKPTIKTKAQLKNEIEKDSEISDNKLIFDRGKRLFFYISKNDIKHEFEVELLEDLYFFKKKNAKNDDFRLYDCACVVKRNISHTIEFFEEVNAKSLNEAYKKTYVHYFGNKGNPACNAIDRFYEKAGNESLNLRKYRV